MATLTETAYYTRRTINWLILAVIMYFILRIFWAALVGIFLAVFPPQAPPPNHRFGKLPAVVFPVQATPSGQLTFQLQTIQGSVPPASSSATVFFMPKAAPNLLALSQTEDFAANLGFNPTPTAETKSIYRFNDNIYPLRTFHYDIVSNNFTIKYDFSQDTGLFIGTRPPLVEIATADAKSFLQTYKLFNDDLSHGTSKISFLKLVSDHFGPATSLSEADAVKIDFFRQSINGMQVFTPNSNQGQAYVIYSGSQNQKKKMLQLTYNFWPIDYLTFATYALKTSNQAWQELQGGGGYIASYPTNGNTAIVRQIYLAYYDSFDPQPYLQPVFVFQGDYGFLAFVAAVSPEWTQ